MSEETLEHRKKRVSEKHRLLVKHLGYEFSDPLLVDLALSHRSIGAKNNERLEFLGDSIVNFLIGEALFQQFPKAREGELSQMRAKLVKGQTLAEIAREFDLGEYLNLGPGELKSGGYRRESILADAVEALIAAIYIDGGMDVCRERVLAWYGARLQAMSTTKSNKDAKSILQELLQSQKKPLPNYRLLTTTGNDHEQLFEVGCEINYLNKRYKGQASSRRLAEQIAAQAALDELQKL
ncbi:ribonuclease III [bacterium AH-315-K03]|nr:ribonuclease III [bacterium AH-315-K03]